MGTGRINNPVSFSSIAWVSCWWPPLAEWPGKSSVALHTGWPPGAQSRGEGICRGYADSNWWNVDLARCFPVHWHMCS